MVRSAMNTPRAATRLCTSAAASSAGGVSSIDAARSARSSSIAAARFASARRDCHSPSETKAAQASTASASAQARGRKEYPRSMRYVVIAVFIAIVASLFSALFFVYRDRSSSTRALKALALRVGLSIALFAFLMLGYYFGWIRERL